jgi:hypothetical protein
LQFIVGVAVTCSVRCFHLLVLLLQVSELQEMVAWLTNHDHVIKDSPINPTPPELTPGLLDPNVSG